MLSQNIFWLTFYFWKQFQFSTKTLPKLKIMIVGRHFDFWTILDEISILGQNYDFWTKLRFFAEISIFGQTFYFLAEISIMANI